MSRNVQILRPKAPAMRSELFFGFAIHLKFCLAWLVSVFTHKTFVCYLEKMYLFRNGDTLRWTDKCFALKGPEKILLPKGQPKMMSASNFKFIAFDCQVISYICYTVKV